MDDIHARRRSRSRSHSPSNPSFPPLRRRRGGGNGGNGLLVGTSRGGALIGGNGGNGLLVGTSRGGALIGRSQQQQQQQQRQQGDTWSDFSSVANMPRDKIVKRTLHSWSVRYSSSSSWTAKIALPETETSYISSDNSDNVKVRHVQYEFPTEKEGRKFCMAYAPPKLRNDSRCQLCHKSGSFRRCRNCGCNCCDTCATKWGKGMLPKTYLSSLHAQQENSPGSTSSKVVRVCKACDWLSNAFCMSLLQGRYQDALQLYDTGNVNLRTSFADIHQEAMFPVHCAVMGGSLDCVTWLIDKECCPITATTITNNRAVAASSLLSKGVSVQTSSSRTLLDLAMTGRPKLDILAFLVRKGLSIVTDVNDSTLIAKTLEVIMKSSTSTTTMSLLPALFDGAAVPVVEDEAMEDVTSSSNWDGNTCHICYEQPMDCVLSPCGHQVCCTECATQLKLCPVCKAPCNFLRIFRS